MTIHCSFLLLKFKTTTAGEGGGEAGRGKEELDWRERVREENGGVREGGGSSASGGGESLDV